MTTSEPALPFSRRIDALRPSSVREILKAAEQPGILSLAGGLPAPELFPRAAIAAAMQRVIADHGARALQYSVTEGHEPLREWIAARLLRRGVRSSVPQLLITNGSQQGIDLVARALLDPGDVVVTENPSYLAALQCFAASEAEIVAVGSDDDGMRTDELARLLARRKARLIYLCPDFQNPKGTTLAAGRRIELAELARRHRLVVLEDDPYGELRFRGEAPPAIASFDEPGAAGRVVRLGTFSKTLAPGLRIGWLHGPLWLIEKLAILKQAADLHTATLAQWATAELLTRFDYDGHIAALCAVYSERQRAMVAALAATLGRGGRWTDPDGGLFLWLSLPPGLDDEAVFRAALARKVAIVPGSGFFVGAAQRGFVRLNFSNQQPAAISAAIGRLGDALRTLTGRGDAAARATGFPDGPLEAA